MGADVYLDRVDLQKYRKLKDQHATLFHIIEQAENILPEVPVPETPVSVDCGAITFGDPDARSPVLVTGNSLYTHMVLGTVMATASIDCYLLSIDTNGLTVDMSVIGGTFSGKKVDEVINASEMTSRVGHRTLIIPGFTARLRRDVEENTGWEVMVGPICAVELPLFLASNWNGPDL